MAGTAVLMATCNGARYLPDQLESIAAQTWSDWHLYVRDDGSHDDTRAILRAFARAYPGKVSILEDDLGQLGALGNFACLLSEVEAPYFAFADQDDVWRPDRLARTHARLSALEARHGRGTPCLVHGDRAVIDAEGRCVTPSYWASRRLDPRWFDRPERAYVFCFAAGSTMLFNRSLRDLALPIDPSARMYDCWIELVALGFGAVDVTRGVLLDHRRHGGNASGRAGDNDSPFARKPWARAIRLLRERAVQRSVYASYFRQAEAFRRRFADRLSPEARARLDGVLSMPDSSLPSRAAALWRTRAVPPGLARLLVFLILSAGAAPRCAAGSGGALRRTPQTPSI